MPIELCGRRLGVSYGRYCAMIPVAFDEVDRSLKNRQAERVSELNPELRPFAPAGRFV